MARHVALGSLSVCLLLLPGGFSVIAGELILLDLSESAPSVPPVNTDPSTAEEKATEQSAPAAIDEGGLFGWRRPAPHFSLPSRSYSLYRSPASYGWAYFERCAPTPWKPRGNGIPRRTSCFRMDYAPYVLKHDRSAHGPAFYQRYELYPCEECHAHSVHLREYYGVGR